MVELIRKFESCVIKIARVDSIRITSSGSRSRRTDRWVHFQQNAGLRLYVHTWIVHGIDDW